MVRAQKDLQCCTRITVPAALLQGHHYNLFSVVCDPMQPAHIHSPYNASEVTLCGLQEDLKTASLLGLTEEVVPKLMQYGTSFVLRPTTDQSLTRSTQGDVPKASETALKATVADPLNMYLNDTPVNASFVSGTPERQLITGIARTNPTIANIGEPPTGRWYS